MIRFEKGTRKRIIEMIRSSVLTYALLRLLSDANILSGSRGRWSGPSCSSP